MPRDVIHGFVLDENGKQIAGANVTLWQDGQLWQPGPLAYPESVNPQASGDQDDRRGAYLFGLVAPGQYSLTAEKYGYQSTISVNISNDTLLYPLKANVTLGGFDVGLSREQLSYAGAIDGSIQTMDGLPSSGSNVSLWQSGRMVNISNNPQSAGSNFQFKHLSPGQYEVKVQGINAGKSVNVTDGTVTVNFVFPIYRPPSTPSPPPSPPPSPSTSLPTNGPGMMTILLSISLVVLLVSISRRTR